MSRNVSDGDFYIQNRKMKESSMKKDLDKVSEGFEVYSTGQQKKNKMNFLIPDRSDPGQRVMCEIDKIRYVRIAQTNQYLTIQEVEVYDENGVNVALMKNYSNDYKLTQGYCRKETNAGNTTGTPGSKYMGQLTTEQCEQRCNDNYGMASGEKCSAYEIQTEESTEGLDPNCWIYRDPSVTGNNDKNHMCRIRERLPGTPTARMSSLYKGTNPYMAINGNIQNDERWPNSACTSSPAGGWWEVDLGKEVNVKSIVVYNRPDCCQERLKGATLTLIDRNHTTVHSETLNSSRRQVFKIKLDKKQCGGPVMKKNINDFDELKELETEYLRELEMYNQSIKNLIDNSQKYVNASNHNKNKFANTYVSDGGAVGYVTDRGVWKWISSPSIANSVQSRAQCPADWAKAKKVRADEGQDYTISNAPQGEIVKMDGVELIRGSNMVEKQTCGGAGQNLYVTQPATTTKGPDYTGCKAGWPGEYQSDLGNTSYETCAQRAADKGSNIFHMGSGGTCYVGGSANDSKDGNYCGSKDGKKIGGEIPGYYTGGFEWFTGSMKEGYENCGYGPSNSSSRRGGGGGGGGGGGSGWDWNWGGWGGGGDWGWGGWGGLGDWSWGRTWHPPVPVYSRYTTEGANNSTLGKSYHITDDLKARNIPEGELFKRGTKGSPGKYQVLNGYGSKGNDIKSGTANDTADIKNMCDETDGCAGFSFKPSTGQYWLKNSNMWPSGNRHKVTNGNQLYVRAPELNLNKSCNSTDINFASQNDMWDTQFGQYTQGPQMTSKSTCALGTISQRDMQSINNQYKKLQAILDKIKYKITELSKQDIILNNRLVKEYNTLHDKLKQYENVYKEIKTAKKLLNHDTALEEDGELNMLSYNKQYIIWSILALGTTYGAMKLAK